MDDVFSYEGRHPRTEPPTIYPARLLQRCRPSASVRQVCPDGQHRRRNGRSCLDVTGIRFVFWVSQSPDPVTINQINQPTGPLSASSCSPNPGPLGASARVEWWIAPAGVVGPSTHFAPSSITLAGFPVRSGQMCRRPREWAARCAPRFRAGKKLDGA